MPGVSVERTSRLLILASPRRIAETRWRDVETNGKTRSGEAPESVLLIAPLVLKRGNNPRRLAEPCSGSTSSVCLGACFAGPIAPALPLGLL